MFFKKRPKESNEIDIRMAANETAKIILKRTEDIQEYVQLLSDVYSNNCSEEDINRAMEILNHAISETKMAVNIVRDGEINKVKQTVEAADIMTKALYDEVMSILKKTQGKS